MKLDIWSPEWQNGRRGERDVRRKIANTISEDLYRALKERAFREGKPINQVMEEALRAYLARPRERSVVHETYGSLKVPVKVARQVAEADLYDAD